MRVAELSVALGDEKRALDALVRKLGSEQYRQRVDGEWTVKDILGHLAAYLGAERLALAAGVGRGKEPAVYFDHFQPWNEQQYQLRRERTPGQIVAELQENSARFLALVKSLHEEDLIKQIRFPWNETGTVHQLIVEGLDHRREHREQLAAALSLGA